MMSKILRTRATAWAAFVFLSAVAISGGATSAYADEPPIVVELFTSQGCSSCPPADKLLAELATAPDILTLSFAIEYWDYLGWHDTLAHPDNTERQRSYNAMFHSGSVYTPQMVINGATHEIGSRRNKVADKIEGMRKSTRRGPDVTFKPMGQYLRLSILGDMAHEDPCKVWVVPYKARQAVRIGRGENQGRDLVYTNVVRAIRDVGAWMGESLVINYDTAQDKDLDIDGYVVLVQENGIGPIVSAARYPVVN